MGPYRRILESIWVVNINKGGDVYGNQRSFSEEKTIEKKERVSEGNKGHFARLKWSLKGLVEDTIEMFPTMRNREKNLLNRAKWG